MTYKICVKIIMNNKIFNITMTSSCPRTLTQNKYCSFINDGLIDDIAIFKIFSHRFSWFIRLDFCETSLIYLDLYYVYLSECWKKAVNLFDQLSSLEVRDMNKVQSELFKQ